MSVFPSEAITIDSIISDTTNSSSIDELPLFKEYAWDFKNSDFIFENGKFKIVEGDEALKIWILKSLSTKRYKYMAYSWEYGAELEDLVGQPFSIEARQSEVERYLKETLTVNPYIKNITNVSISVDGSSISVDFRANTIYGEVDINV